LAVDLVAGTADGPLRRLGEAKVPALPNAAALVRALRPLQLVASARGEDQMMLDEEATAERAVQDQLWLPQLKPVRQRLLDLTLVIDANPSTALWRATIAGFGTFVEQLGVFRTIQRRLLDVQPSTTGGRPAPVLRGGTPNAPFRRPADVVDPTGRRVVLVLTDGVCRHWRDGVFTATLADWGRTMPTSVIHLLPQRLWRQHGLPVHRGRLVPGGRLRPNSRWSLQLPDEWLGSPTADTPNAVPVPVFELGARWLSRWAQLLLGTKDGPLDAPVLLAGEERVSDDSAEPASDRSARERVKKFRHTASPTAFRLATLLAGVPVTLGVARLVQREMVPEAEAEHITEVLTSDLFEPATDNGGRQPWDSVRFYARKGVREELVTGLRRSETVRVVRMVLDRFGDQFCGLLHLEAAIEDPDRAPDPDISVTSLHDVVIERIVMKALSGPYLSRADRIVGQVRELADSVDPSGAGGGSTTRKDGQGTSGAGDNVVVAGRTTVPTSGEEAPAGPKPDPQLLPSPEPAFRQPDTIPQIWGSVPPRNPNFTGRGELLDRLEDCLTDGGTAAVVPAALYGMGGIGKTQIVVEYVYRYMQEYEVVWWIPAAHSTQIRASLTELAEKLGLPDSAEPDTAVPAVREALRRGDPYRRWLLVFDAADAPDRVRPFIPVSEIGKVLITSRNPAWATVARPLEIATFERAESIELLSRRGPAIGELDADRLAATLGDLPLAIEQAAAWRAETGMPVEEYLRLFDEKVAEILDTSGTADYELSVAAAWNVSFDELKTRSPAAHQLLQVCAFFSPEPISRALFAGVRGISIAPELDLALSDPIRLARAIRDINRYSLAKVDHRNNTLQLHRLVQLVLCNRMSEEHQVQMRHGAHLLLANRDPNEPMSQQYWQRYRDLLSHAYSSDLVDCEDAWARLLVINLISFLYRWGDHAEAIELGERALDSWTQVLGAKDPKTLEVAGLLGRYYWVVGQYDKATEIDQQTWATRCEVDGFDSIEALTSQLNLAEDLRPRGDFPGALRQSAEIYRKVRNLLHPDDPVMLNIARRHAIDLRLTGQYRKAADLDEDVYYRANEVLGQDHPETLSALSGLIMDRREAGEYPWALGEQERLARRAQQVHGENNADTLRRFAYLAVGRRKAGDHQGALELSRETVERFRVRYGLQSFNAMGCALGYSIDLRYAGELRLSREVGEQVLNRYRGNLGEQHPYTLAATVDLAITLRLQGDAGSATELDATVLRELRLSLGPDHPHAVVVAIDLASDLAALGGFTEALTVGIEAEGRSSRMLGIDHPTTLAAGLNISADLRAVGRSDVAEQRHSVMIERYRRVLGAHHPATREALAGMRANCDIDPLPL
jgi:tetratricopeptide (TPR) repeat protein